MIETSLLEQLVAFAEYGTLSEAAAKLHTSQPAVTRAMKRLENDLNVPLFTRTKNHISLNETGLLAVDYGPSGRGLCKRRPPIPSRYGREDSRL